MARLLDSHSSSISILDSTFPIGHLCKAQIVVNLSSKRLVSMNTFKFLSNYSMVVKIICLHQNLEEGSQKLESSQNLVSNGSIVCGSKPADSDAALESAFFK